MSSPTFEPSQSPNYSFVRPTNPSPNMQTLLEYIDALNAWDLERILNVFDETLEHRILPKSLGRPVLNKKQYSAYCAGLHDLLKDFRLIAHEVIESDDVITVHASTKGQGQSGAPYNNEAVLIIHFVPPRAGGDGRPKMSLVKEFVDSAMVTTFFKEERAKAAARQHAQN